MNGEAGRLERPRLLRPSAKAVVLRGGCLLVTRNRSDRDLDGEWLLLPGGGQRPGESLHEALRREVFEETGLLVRPLALLWIREYIGAHHEFAHWSADEHQIEFMFSADAEAEEARPPRPDDHQVGTEWVPVGDLHQRRFYPRAAVEPIVRLAGGGDPGPVYLGDVN